MEIVDPFLLWPYLINCKVNSAFISPSIGAISISENLMRLFQKCFMLSCQVLISDTLYNIWAALLSRELSPKNPAVSICERREAQYWGPCEYFWPKDLRGSETWLSVSNFLINPRPVENVGVVSVVPWEVKGRRVYEIGLGISGRGWQSNLKLCEDDTVMGWWRGVVIRIHIIWRKPKEGPGFKRKGELGSWKIAVKITTIIMPIGNTELKTLGRGNSCPYSLTYCQAALSSESWKLLFFFFFLWVPTVSHQTWVKISSTEWDPRCTSGPQHHLTWGPIVRCVPHVWGQRDTRLWVFTAPEAWTLSHIAPNNTCLVF